jgi:hypothetical protein
MRSVVLFEIVIFILIIASVLNWVKLEVPVIPSLEVLGLSEWISVRLEETFVMHWVHLSLETGPCYAFEQLGLPQNFDKHSHSHVLALEVLLVPLHVNKVAQTENGLWMGALIDVSSVCLVHK